MANILDPLLPDRLARIFISNPKTLDLSHLPHLTPGKRQTIIDYILRQLASELPPVDNPTFQNKLKSNHHITCKLTAMREILLFKQDNFTSRSVDAALKTKSFHNKSFISSQIPDWKLESSRLLYLSENSFQFPVYPKLTNFPLNDHPIYLAGKLFRANPTSANLKNLLRLTKQTKPTPQRLTLFRNQHQQYKPSSRYHHQLQSKLKLNLDVEKHKKILYTNLIKTTNDRLKQLQNIYQNLLPLSPLDSVFHEISKHPHLQKSLATLSEKSQKHFKLQNIQKSNKLLESRLSDISNLYFPDLKQKKFPRSSYQTLFQILSNLIRSSLDDPENPYLIINPIDHWQAYIELLIQAEIAEPHPIFPQLLKLVDFLR